MARPRKEISKTMFEGLCKIQCTQEEMCDALGVTDKTLNSWCKREYGQGFSEVFRQKRNLGKTSLRRMQWKRAKEDTGMLIWLGKQYLGQQDKQEKEEDASQITIINNIPREPVKKAAEQNGEK